MVFFPQNSDFLFEVTKLITKEEFLRKYNISEELFISAGISWEDLCEIYKDFSNNKRERYEAIRDDFFNNYLKNISNGVNNTSNNIKIHSIRSRVKDPEHLIEKIVRKKQENQHKYKNLDKTNYEKFLTDLIGFRCLILFKADWTSFHDYIISTFENIATNYINDPISDFDEDPQHFYIAEKPKVHIRNGDNRAIYDAVFPPDCVIDGKIYRSIHYIIKYKGIYLEIQVRTIFEEGWGEVDHTILYPYHQNDRLLNDYTELLNRLTGLADEMSGFFYRLENIETSDNPAADTKFKANNPKVISSKSFSDAENMIEANTPFACLQKIFNE